MREKQQSDKLLLNNAKGNYNRCDRDAIYFLAVVLVILTTFAFFNREILKFIFTRLF